MFGFFVLHRPAKFSNLLAEFVIMTVGVCGEFCFLHIKLAGFGIEILIIGLYIDYIRNKHIVRTEGDDLFHLALDTERRFFDNGRCNHC